MKNYKIHSTKSITTYVFNTIQIKVHHNSNQEDLNILKTLEQENPSFKDLSRKLQTNSKLTVEFVK